MNHRHCFVDTNVFVYAHDYNSDSSDTNSGESGNKHQTAQELLRQIWKNPYPPAISTQVLQELYVSLAKRGADAKDCQEIVSLYFSWEVVEHNVSLIESGIRYKERYQLSLWDGLIIAAAIKAKAAILYTEGLQHGMKIENMTIVNPFPISSP